VIKLKNIFIILVFFLHGCGYQAVNKMSINKYTILKYELNGDKEISRHLKKNFNKFTKSKNHPRKYTIKTQSKINKKINSKDSLGVAEALSLEINITITVKENDKILWNKSYLENVNYSNMDNKFELNQYEKNIIKNQTEKIINKINFSIASIK